MRSLAFSRLQHLLLCKWNTRPICSGCEGWSLIQLLGWQGRRFGAAALRCVARVAAKAPDWGVIFFGYDWFAAYSAATARTVSWDVLIPHYKVYMHAHAPIPLVRTYSSNQGIKDVPRSTPLP